MSINEATAFIRSRLFVVIILTVASIAALLGSFGIGVAVGYHKARASYAWGESYNRVFAGPRGGFMGGMMGDAAGRGYIDANGVYGQIVKIDVQSLVIGARDGLERVVTILPNTVIRRFQEQVNIADVHVGDAVVVVGTSDTDGRILAQLIRVMPPAGTALPPMMVPSVRIPSR
jgi:hypothetical protein